MPHPQPFPCHGVTLHHDTRGAGPGVLLVPGSISDMRTWQPVLPRLATRFRCVALSRRYQHPATYTGGGDSGVQANVDDLAAFIGQELHGAIDVVAHSFGGYVAIELALQHPRLVRRLVLEEPIFTPALVRNPDNPLELLRLFFRDRKAGASFLRLGLKGVKPTFKALARGDTVHAMHCFIDGVTEGTRTPDTLDALTRDQLVDNIAALAGEDPFRHPFRGTLTELRAPVLLVSGTRSPYFFQYIARRLCDRIPHARLEAVPGAAHWVHIDAPDAFSRAVEFFLEE